MENIETFPHKVYSYYTKDTYGNITLNKLLPLILDSAGSHAKILGFSKNLLISEGYTWVLSRLNLTLMSLESNLETIYVTTWIQNVKSAFSIRLFEVHDGKGKVLAYGSSYWSIINIKTRKITAIQKVIGQRDVINSKEIPCQAPQKLLFDRGNFIGQVTAQYSDLDYNGHVNSNRYVEWGLNSFTSAFLSDHKLTRMELNYNNEVYCGNTINIYNTASPEYNEIELYNTDQEQTACKMRLHFALRGQ